VSKERIAYERKGEKGKGGGKELNGHTLHSLSKGSNAKKTRHSNGQKKENTKGPTDKQQETAKNACGDGTQKKGREKTRIETSEKKGEEGEKRGEKCRQGHRFSCSCREGTGSGA